MHSILLRSAGACGLLQLVMCFSTSRDVGAFVMRAQTASRWHEGHHSAFTGVKYPGILPFPTTLLRVSQDTEQSENRRPPDNKTKYIDGHSHHRRRRKHKEDSSSFTHSNGATADDHLNRELSHFRRNRRNGAQLAHQRLELALKERDPTINEKSFNTVFLAYAAQSARGDWMAPLRTEQLLQKMKRHAKIHPSVFSYNAVMEAWVKSATSTSASSITSNRRSRYTSQQQPREHHHRHHHHQPQKQRSIVQAKNTVLRLFEEMTKGGEDKSGLKPTTYTYNLILELFSKSPNPHDLRKAEEWFLGMENCEPDRQTFNHMFAAHATHGKAQQAERLLHGLIEHYLEGHDTDEPTHVVVPSPVWFHCVLKAYAQDQKSSSFRTSADIGEQADQLLEDMQQLCLEEGLESLRPDATTYNHVINVHAQAGNVVRVQELMQELERLHHNSYNTEDGTKPSSKNMAPDRITYTTALKAFAHTHVPGGTEQAEELFQRMLDLAAAGRPNMSPSVVTYNTMIQIWAKTGSKEHLKKATELLEQMQQSSSSSSSSSTTSLLLQGLPRPPPAPNAQTLTAIIHGWSRTKNVREAGYRAEELLHMLQRLAPNARRNLNWTTVYNSVITAWSKSGDKAAPQRVESLLNLLEDQCFDSDGAIAPDKTTFLCIADTYAKARIPDAEQRCEGLLARMKQLEEAGVVPTDILSNRALYNSILNALAKSGQPSSKDKAEEILTMMQTSPVINLRPDIVTYATVIDCHTKSGSNKTADRAEELLRFVEGSYRNGDELLKPNAVFYSAILQAWAKTATLEGAERAQWLLRRNEGLYQQGKGYQYAKPHAIMYNAVMDSIARSGMPGAGERAEELLNEMMSLYEAGDDELKPTRRSFNAVVLAYRHDGQGAEKAEKLLDRMEDLAETHGINLSPDVVSYNCAIQAIVENLGATDLGIAASRAQALLDRMEDRFIRPDATTYSSVIEAWLKCNNEKGSVMAELMLQKFLELVESTKEWEAKLDADAVWDVINAYKKGD